MFWLFSVACWFILYFEWIGIKTSWVERKIPRSPRPAWKQPTHLQPKLIGGSASNSLGHQLVAAGTTATAAAAPSHSNSQQQQQHHHHHHHHQSLVNNRGTAGTAATATSAGINGLGTSAAAAAAAANLEALANAYTAGIQQFTTGAALRSPKPPDSGFKWDDHFSSVETSGN